MNIDLIRNEITKYVNEEVSIKEHKMRNKTFSYQGVVKSIYPNLFTVLVEEEEKSISFTDVITGDVVVKLCK